MGALVRKSVNCENGYWTALPADHGNADLRKLHLAS